MRNHCLISFFLAIVASNAHAKLSAVWVQEGLDKITQEEIRGEQSRSRVWDGNQVALASAKNETVSFALVLESASDDTRHVSVEFNSLKTADGKSLQTDATPSLSQEPEALFRFDRRLIEVFFVRYLKVRGLSTLFYETYDERHIPQSLRLPHDAEGRAQGAWSDRPKHDQSFPEILAPIELHPRFDVLKGKSQMIWVDVTVPKESAAGIYTGEISVREGKESVRKIPVRLEVFSFALPDEPSLKTMLYLGYSDLSLRYTGTAWPLPLSREEKKLQVIRDRHFQMAHRHRISLIDSNQNGSSVNSTHPLPEWKPRLDGSLFSRAHGYRGPGENTGNGVFSIGTYGQWSWKDDGEKAMHDNLNRWAEWFDEHAPRTELFLYLIDESEEYGKIEAWAKSVRSNPGKGKRIRSFATLPLVRAAEKTPSLDIAASWFTVGDTTAWKNAVKQTRAQRKPLYFYNGKRPGTPSFAIEDDGIALRAHAWNQYKHAIDRWFYWESTYYNNYQAGAGQTDVFSQAQTFGKKSTHDASKGDTGWNYSNGDGVLFYPGTDKVYSKSSYGIPGPIASLRLKAWRRGIQDVDYLKLASEKNPARVQELMNRLVRRSLWENGIADSADPTWVRCPVGWEERSGPWEDARLELAAIIEGRPAPVVATASDEKAIAVPEESLFKKMKQAAKNTWRSLRNLLNRDLTP